MAAKNFFGMVVPHRMFSHGGTGQQFLPKPGVAAGNNNSELFQPRGDISRNLLGGEYLSGGQTVSITGNGSETCSTYNLSHVDEVTAQWVAAGRHTPEQREAIVSAAARAGKELDPS